MSRGATKWAKIVDLHKMRVTFRTDVNPRLRHIVLGSFNYSCDMPCLILDVHADLSGDVSASFKEYTDEAHRTMVEKTIEVRAGFSEFELIIKAMGGTREGLTKRISEYPTTMGCQ